MIKRLLFAAALLASLGSGPADAAAPVDTEPLEGRIIAISGDHFEISIDVGNSGIKGDDVGVIRRNGIEIGLATVVFVDVGHTTMRVVSKTLTSELQTGDTVVFDQTRTAAGPLPQPDFVPLLAPANMPKTALARTANVFHGRVRGSQLYQTISPNGAWFEVSRLDLDGSLERIRGEPWSLVWSGNVRYRDGSTFSTSDDFRRAKPHLYRLTLARKSEDGGFLRLGRIFPTELPGLGYLDGAQAEEPAGGSVRLGAAAGLRPDRVTQGFSSQEAMGAVYGTLEKGAPRELYYSGTLGALHTLYRGRRDELAALLDQRADLGPKLNLMSSSQVDFDAGAAVQHHGARLTRQDLTANAPVSSWLSLTGGAGHYEPLDAQAERDLAGGSSLYLDNGYWRYWSGSGQSLPGGVQLDEQLSWTAARGRFAPGLWRASVSKRGLSGLPSAYASLSLYNLYNPFGPDYGGSLSASLPLWGDALALDAAVSLRDGPTDGPTRRLTVSDLSLHAAWRMTRAWLVDLGVSRNYQSSLRSTTYNGGLSYQW